MAAGVGDIRFSGGATAGLAFLKKKKKKKKNARHMLRRDFCSTRGANRWPVSRKLIETLVFEKHQVLCCYAQVLYLHTYMYKEPFYNLSARLFSELDI